MAISMRVLTEQYRAEAECLDGMIDTLRASQNANDSDTKKRIDILCSMRRENLSTYRHLLGYCERVYGGTKH